MSEVSGDRAQKQRPALVAVDLGAESCRVSLLHWRDGQPEIQLVHRFPMLLKMTEAACAGISPLSFEAWKKASALAHGSRPRE